MREKFSWYFGSHGSGIVTAAPKLGRCGFADLGLKRLGALLVNKRWRVNAGLNTELVFHANAPKNCHSFVDRAKVGFTGFVLDLTPANGETDAGEVWISPDRGLKSTRVGGGFRNFLGDP